MNYFSFEKDSTASLEQFENSQFDLSDIVLSLTDNNINKGAKIYALFLKDEVKCCFFISICDFKKIKRDLGINGQYIERNGDPYSPKFNPKRNIKALTLSREEMEERAEKVYANLLEDLYLIANKLLKKART